MCEKSKVVRLQPYEQKIIQFLRNNSEEIVSELNELERGVSPSFNDYRNLKQLRTFLQPDNYEGIHLEELVKVKMLTKEQSIQLMEAVNENKNIIIQGCVGAGKTTLLYALLDYKANHLSSERRTIVTEEMEELKKICQENPMIIYRNYKDFSIFDFNFLRESLEPSQLIIGETRGKDEIVAMTSAFTLGSSIMTTIQGEDWKSRLFSYCNNEEYLKNQAFTIVTLTTKYGIRTVASIKEEIL